MSPLSFLDIVDTCDNVHFGPFAIPSSTFDEEPLVPFFLSDAPDSPLIGLLRPAIVDRLLLENALSASAQEEALWSITLDESQFLPRNNRPLRASVSFMPWLDTHSKRTEAIAELCERWRDTGLFSDVCGPNKWRAELYPVYADPFGPRDHPNKAKEGEESNFVFEMERSACALFGVVTYGVHLSIFREDELDGVRSLQIWVPTRSQKKQTWPGLLDNTVAGGIPSGMSVFESLVKECMEEASIPEDIVRKHVRAVGSISYFIRTSQGWLQPEIEFVYDLHIPHDADASLFEPKPLDGEVERFELLPQDEVITRMRQGLFKPNCALVLLDLFIRRGYVTPDNEPDYMKIVTRIHGRFDFDRW